MTAPTNRVGSRSHSCSSSCARPCTFFRDLHMLWKRCCFWQLWRIPYAMSGSLVPAIERLDWMSFFLTVGWCFSEKMAWSSPYQFRVSLIHCLSLSVAFLVLLRIVPHLAPYLVWGFVPWATFLLFLSCLLQAQFDLWLESSSVSQIHMFHLAFSIQLRTGQQFHRFLELLKRTWISRSWHFPRFTILFQFL